MQQKQAAQRLGLSIGTVHNWVRAYREGGMAALQPRNRNASQGGKVASRPSAAVAGDDEAEVLRRRVEELELENALMREAVGSARMTGTHGAPRADAVDGCKGSPPPDNATVEGFFGRMKTEAVYPEHWEEHARDEMFALTEEYIH